MKARSPRPALTDIMEAIGRIREVIASMPLEEFAADWQKQ